MLGAPPRIVQGTTAEPMVGPFLDTVVVSRYCSGENTPEKTFSSCGHRLAVVLASVIVLYLGLRITTCWLVVVALLYVQCWVRRDKLVPKSLLICFVFFTLHNTFLASCIMSCLEENKNARLTIIDNSGGRNGSQCYWTKLSRLLFLGEKSLV